MLGYINNKNKKQLFYNELLLVTQIVEIDLMLVVIVVYTNSIP